MGLKYVIQFFKLSSFIDVKGAVSHILVLLWIAKKHTSMDRIVMKPSVMKWVMIDWNWKFINDKRLGICGL